MEVFMNDREFSDIQIFQHPGKGIPLFMTCHKNFLQADYNNGWRFLFSKLSEITSELQMSPRRDEVTRDWRKLHNEELRNLYNDQVKEDEMGRACSTNGGDEECV
jgi:hypothetical protein